VTRAPWVEALTNAWSPVRRAPSSELPANRISGMFASNRTEQLQQMAQVGTLFSIVDRIASSQSRIEWCLYRKARNGRKEDRTEVTSHLAIDLMEKPNDFQSGGYLVEAGQQHYELTGETWLVVDREDSFRDIPLGMWVVRPDRIEPVPGETQFIVGYIYTSSDGEKIPLRLDEVLRMNRPNPEDPYRGLGAVQAAMREVWTSRALAEWNLNFFRNGAIPGGVIEVPQALTDTQFSDLIRHWRESHKGVSRAHRVGVLEQGAKFNATTYSVKDLMITELRGMTRDALMEAFGVSKTMLGITEDVNRANAVAGEYQYAKYVDLPRAIRWRDMWNNFYLPLFGPTAEGLEWDFTSPVPEDTEAANAERESKAKAAKDLNDAGYNPDDVTEAVGLPKMRHTGRAPVPTGGTQR